MKVLYMISSVHHGFGGHFWSLRSLVEAMDGEIDAGVVNVGRNPASAFCDVRVPYWDVLWRPPRLWAAVRHVDRLVRAQEPHILHSFDQRALFFARIMAARHGKALVHTQCGGPNPGGYFPQVGNLVVFSEENRDHFVADPRFRSSRIHLIPNRVNEVNPDPHRIARLRKGLGPEASVFLRISTVSAARQGASLQSLALVKQLREDGIAAHFVQVGAVIDDSSLACIGAALGPQDRLLTDAGMAFRASELIDGADFVIGTGRSLMEAASRGRVLLVPLADAPHPALVTPDNFHRLFRTNFSARSRLSGFSSRDNYAAILEAVSSPAKRDELGRFGRQMFDEFFSMASAIPAYLALYGELVPNRSGSAVDTALHAAWTLKHG